MPVLLGSGIRLFDNLRNALAERSGVTMPKGLRHSSSTTGPLSGATAHR